jgi:hypothetical protein
MKRLVKNKQVLFILFLVVCTSATVFAAGPPGPPGGGGGGYDCWPPPCVPIDGGVSLLIAAGIFYGGKKIYDNRK